MCLSLQVSTLNLIKRKSLYQRLKECDQREKGEKRVFSDLENQTSSSKFAGASSRQVHPRPRCCDSRWIRVEEFAFCDSSIVIKPEACLSSTKWWETCGRGTHD